MFKLGDRVIVTENYEGNNTKNQEGVIVDVPPHRTVCIMFDNKLKSGHNGFGDDKNQYITKQNHCWSVDIQYVKKIEESKGEY